MHLHGNPIRALSVLRGTVLMGRRAVFFLEQPNEVAGVAKAGFKGNVSHLHLGRFQQKSRVLQSQVVSISAQAHPCTLLE